MIFSAETDKTCFCVEALQINAFGLTNGQYMITNVKMSYVLQPFDFQAEVILSESNFASNKYKWWLEKKQCHGFGRGARPGMGGKIGGMRVLMKMMHKRRAKEREKEMERARREA